MNEYLARALGATRRYRSALAVDGVDLDVPPGQLIGMLGPNGAGKTTLLNMLIGLRMPSAGRVELFGGDPRDPVRRQALGVTPQETGLPPGLRVGEVIDFVARHFPDPLPRAEVMGRFGLADVERRQTGGLSGGQKRRLSVALAFVGRPRLVVLDEPTTGLDVEARHGLWDAVREYHRDGGTVLLTSHYLEEIEELAHRVVVLGAGRVLADGELATVRGLVDLQRVSLRAERIPDLARIARSDRSGDRIDLYTADSDELVRDLVRSGVPFRGLEVRPTSLEEAFRTLTDTSELSRQEPA